MIRMLLAALAASVMIAGCTRAGAETRTYVGPVTEVDTHSVCIGGPEASGECFVKDQVTEHLHVNDCVSVTYAPEPRRLRPYRAKRVAAADVLLGGCGALPGDTADASWTLAAGQEVGPTSKQFEVLVTRVGCNSGVTGTVKEPEIEVKRDRVIVTFVVAPGEPGAANCQGNPEVPYLLTLPERLGSRALADGQCLTNDHYARTAFCVDGGFRHQP